MERIRRTILAEPRLELTPLMDLMFLLMTFFIFAFALAVRLKITDIRLPPAPAGQDMQRAPAIIIALRPDGSLTINEEPVDREALPQRIDDAVAIAPDSRLYIAADEDASSGDLFRLMDALRAAGHADLRFLRLPQRDGAAPPSTAAPR
jgi:biopolymer transport protein ExbD